MNLRVVPEETELSAPYWAAAREGRVLLQRCSVCLEVWHPPQPRCPACRTLDWSWEAAAVDGVIDSFTVVRHAAHQAVASSVPYVIALVRTQQGPRVLCNVLGCANTAVHVGMPVELGLGPTPGGLDLPQAWPSARSGEVGRGETAV